MEPQTRKRLQLVLVIFLALAAIRIALIYRSRHDAGEVGRAQQSSTQINADSYVVPRKLRAYDLKSAEELTKQPVWVREGYKYTYYPYDPARKRANFDQEGGTLGPIEKLQVKSLVEQLAPVEASQEFTGSQGQPIKVRQGPSQYVLAVFEKDGNSFVVPIGRVRGKNYSIYADEIFFMQDPRSLYQHWPAEVWQSIEKHEVKPGMNELQATFAVGMGKPQPSEGDPSKKTVQYPNNGKPQVVVYQDGVVENVKPSS
jgi:hypothetical protein